jgi:hypothetical protein
MAKAHTLETVSEFMKGYEVMEDGRFFSIKSSKFLKPSLSSNGYYMLTLSNGGKTKRFHLHRLVAIRFIPNPHNKPQINHIDGNKQNNNVVNLEWCTAKENNAHAFNALGCKRGGGQRGKFGEEHNNSKQFSLVFPNGEIRRFGSGLEMKRELGFDHTSISYARNKKGFGYTFTQGKMKGLTIQPFHFERVV